LCTGTASGLLTFSSSQVLSFRAKAAKLLFITLLQFSFHFVHFGSEYCPQRSSQAEHQLSASQMTKAADISEHAKVTIFLDSQTGGPLPFLPELGNIRTKT
jgi:hypothetical protein